MRIARWAALLVAVVGTVFLFFCIFATETHGVGFFSQPVVVEADAPIRSIRYAVRRLPPEARTLAEANGEPRMFDWESADFTGERFVARVFFTDRTGGLRPSQVYHDPHLVVLVEFADGGTACRVVDIPPGRSKEAVIANFR